jgi:SNF2 family DNA or RNA helicase
VPYHISRLNPQIFNAWTRAPDKDPGTPMMNGFMHVDRVIKLRNYVLGRPLAKVDVIVKDGQRIAEEDRKLREIHMKSQKGPKKNKGSVKRAVQIQGEHLSELADNSAKKAKAPDTLKEMQKELTASISQLEGDDERDSRNSSTQTVSQQPSCGYSEILSSSPFANVRIGHSASSKINWIINEVKSHAATEKFLIFSDSELSLAHVAESLELIQVKFLRFTAQIEPRFREQLVLTFETSETYRVFLMELKHGARGL